MYRITDLCILCRHICFYIGFLLTVQIVFDLQEHLLYVCVIGRTWVVYHPTLILHLSPP